MGIEKNIGQRQQKGKIRLFAAADHHEGNHQNQKLFPAQSTGRKGRSRRGRGTGCRGRRRWRSGLLLQRAGFLLR